MDWYSTVEIVTSASHKSPSMEQSSQCKVKPDPIEIQALQDLHHHRTKNRYNHF